MNASNPQELTTELIAYTYAHSCFKNGNTRGSPYPWIPYLPVQFSTNWAWSSSSTSAKCTLEPGTPRFKFLQMHAAHWVVFNQLQTLSISYFTSEDKESGMSHSWSPELSEGRIQAGKSSLSIYSVDNPCWLLLFIFSLLPSSFPLSNMRINNLRGFFNSRYCDVCKIERSRAV